MNKNIIEMIEYPEKGILSKEIIKNDSVDVGLFCMAKGKEMSEHTSSKKGSVYVVEGEGIFNLEGKNIEMKPGVYIYMDKDAKHSLKALENTAFVLTLIS